MIRWGVALGLLAGLGASAIAQAPGPLPLPLPPLPEKVTWPYALIYGAAIAFLGYRQWGAERKLKGIARKFRRYALRYRRERDDARRERDDFRRRLEDVAARGEAQGRIVDGVLIPMVSDAVKRQTESGLLPAVPAEEPPK